MSGSFTRERGLGAVLLGGGRCGFRVWAPSRERVELVLLGPQARTVPLERDARGYHEAVVDRVEAGARYVFRLAPGLERPDPASRSQPEGVHAPSEVVDRSPPRDDRAPAPRLAHEHVLYELHVGTFTREGTFDAAIPHLEELRAVGVTAIELLPLSAFPGARNWGYDGVYPFAVQASYGGPAGLKRLVAAAHAKGLHVCLDLVVNHMGPEGNYLHDHGPYFTESYRTPWGAAINFDGEGSDEVRRFFIEAALEAVAAYRFDMLRLDAVHAIVDPSARPFLAELAAAVRLEGERAGRRVLVIAESDRNDPRLVLPPEAGGLGFDGHWSDDFHHALHALLTGERAGYYEDFGALAQLAKAWETCGYAYTGDRSAHRGRRHGAPPSGIAPHRMVVFAQNHDQVGNRAQGDRLSTLTDLAGQKLAAAATLLSPMTPLLFMGEEYGETAPFQYFVSHGDPGLVEAVREGRRAEFAGFAAASGTETPDPADEATFLRSKLDHDRARVGHHRALRALHEELLRLRRERPAVCAPGAEHASAVAYEGPRAVVARRRAGGDEVVQVLRLGGVEQPAPLAVSLPAGRWKKLVDTEEVGWLGRGSDAPALLESTGEVTLPPAGRGALVYGRE